MPLSSLLSSLLLATAAVLFLWAAASDARRFLIPNVISVALAGVFVAYALAHPAGLPWLGHLTAGAVVFLAGAALFLAGLAGGGDVKLLAVAALWAGPDGIALLLLAMAMAGGVLGLVMLLVRELRAPLALPSPAGPVRVPYGVAIATGGWCVLLVHALATASGPLL
jgi:prepilin peptidase CpaA